MAARAVLVPLSRSGGYSSNSNWRGLDSLMNAIDVHTKSSAQRQAQIGDVYDKLTPIVQEQEKARVLEDVKKNNLIEGIGDRVNREYEELYGTPTVAASPQEQALLYQRRKEWESGKYGVLPGQPTTQMEKNINVLGSNINTVEDPVAYSNKVFEEAIARGLPSDQAELMRKQAYERNIAPALTKQQELAIGGKQKVLEAQHKATIDGINKAYTISQQATEGGTTSSSAKNAYSKFGKVLDQSGVSKDLDAMGLENSSLFFGRAKDDLMADYASLVQSGAVSDRAFWTIIGEKNKAVGPGEGGTVGWFTSRQDLLNEMKKWDQENGFTGKYPSGKGTKGGYDAYAGIIPGKKQEYLNALKAANNNFEKRMQVLHSANGRPSDKELLDSVFGSKTIEQQRAVLPTQAQLNANAVAKQQAEAAAIAKEEKAFENAIKNETKEVQDILRADRNIMNQDTVVPKTFTKEGPVFGRDYSKLDKTDAELNATAAEQRQRVLEGAKPRVATPGPMSELAKELKSISGNKEPSLREQMMLSGSIPEAQVRAYIEGVKAALESNRPIHEKRKMLRDLGLSTAEVQRILR